MMEWQLVLNLASAGLLVGAAVCVWRSSSPSRNYWRERYLEEVRLRVKRDVDAAEEDRDAKASARRKRFGASDVERARAYWINQATDHLIATVDTQDVRMLPYVQKNLDIAEQIGRAWTDIRCARVSRKPKGA